MQINELKQKIETLTQSRLQYEANKKELHMIRTSAEKVITLIKHADRFIHVNVESMVLDGDNVILDYSYNVYRQRDPLPWIDNKGNKHTFEDYDRIPELFYATISLPLSILSLPPEEAVKAFNAVKEYEKVKKDEENKAFYAKMYEEQERAELKRLQNKYGAQ